LMKLFPKVSAEGVAALDAVLAAFSKRGFGDANTFLKGLLVHKPSFPLRSFYFKKKVQVAQRKTIFFLMKLFSKKFLAITYLLKQSIFLSGKSNCYEFSVLSALFCRAGARRF